MTFLQLVHGYLAGGVISVIGAEGRVLVGSEAS